MICNSKKKAIFAIVIIMIAAIGISATMFYNHRKEANKTANQEYSEQANNSANDDVAREPTDHHLKGKSSAESGSKELPPINTVNSVLYKMLDLGYKLDTGINFVTYHNEYQKLYASIESFIADYGSDQDINYNFKQVEIALLDLDGYWDMSIEFDAGNVFQDYNPNDKYWSSLRSRHPGIDNAKRNGNHLISIDDVRSTLMHDLKKQMINSSDNIVSKYE